MSADPTIADIFDYSPGNHGLTEEIIYAQQPADPADVVPVFGGSQNNEFTASHVRSGSLTNKGDKIKIFAGPCLILTKDGSAGLLTYKGPGERFTINHHACVLSPKTEWRDRVDLEWFAQQYQSRLFAAASTKGGNSVFSIDWFDRIFVKVPAVEAQRRQARLKARVAKSAAVAGAAAGRIASLLRNRLRVPKAEIVHSEPLSVPLVVKNGNTGLTEQFIYHNLPASEENAVRVQTAALLARNAMGVVAADAVLPNRRALKIFDDRCLLIVRKGMYAGTMAYWDGGRFAPNDDTYIVVPRTGWANRINLEWFSMQYADIFWNVVTSRNHNATFNKEWLYKIRVDLPSRSYQDAVVDRLRRWTKLAAGLNEFREKATVLMRHRFEEGADRAQNARRQLKN